MGQPDATTDDPTAARAAEGPAAVPADQRSAAPRSTSGGRPLRGHLGGLDGWRALAVTAVLLFHLDPGWLPGGFLGVDIFFVISGFLITTLLVRERRDTGRVDLRAFWTRRARRLLPALVVVVPVSILVARTVETDLLVGIGRQALGALTFSTNWLEIAVGSNYFAATSPQLFMNFWSLAVEEQFYLVWPLVTLVLVALHWRTGVTEGVLAGLVASIGLASAVLMAVTYTPENPTRAYYGTDTHLVGLMLGAALAWVWTGPGRAFTTTRTWRRRRPWILLAAGATVGLLLMLGSEEHAWTFSLGIPLVSLATAVLVLGGVDKPGKLRSVLELPPLTWIGQRSYGIYLWHWPVILIVDQSVPTNAGTSDFLWTRAWAVIVTLALADLSHHFVETPVRRLGFRGSVHRVGQRLRSPRSRGLVGAAATAVAVTVGAVMVTAPETSSTQQRIEQNQARATTPRQASPAPTPSDDTTTKGKDGDTADFTMPKGDEISIFGDSMVVGSVPALEYYFPGVRVDAKSNRRWSDGLAAVREAGDSLRRGVVLAFGTNAGTDPDTVEQTIDAIGEDRMVVIVNLHADRLARIDDDNAELRRIAQEHDNVTIADWDDAVSPEDLQPDGIHPSLGGAHTYAATIRQAFADLSEQHTGKEVQLEEKPRP